MSRKEEIMSIEKKHYRQVTTREGSEASRNSEHPLEESDELMITIEKQVNVSKSTLEENWQSMRDANKVVQAEPNNKPKPLIQRVPFTLRGHKNFEKYFEPRAVAIGPIHHNKPGLQLAEQLKLRLAHRFIIDNVGEQEKNKLYKAIEYDITYLRSRYEKEVVNCYNNEELVWMLFVDGCALLKFIQGVIENKLEDLEIKNDLAAFGQQDVFLLENQLPYEVLKLLIENSTNKSNLEKSITCFIEKMALVNPQKKPKTTCFTKIMALVNPKKEQEKKTNTQLPDQNKEIDEASDCPIHLLDLLRTKLLLPDNKSHKSRNNQEAASNNNNSEYCVVHMPVTFRNIKELKAAGIGVKCSKSCSLTDISFNSGIFSFMATLNLPLIIVDDWTGPKFSNLVAYEMCPDFVNDYGITSYVWFLDSLIDQPEDVKELRDANIMCNILGSDEQVATLFNEISTDLVPNSQMYEGVKNKIQEHYENKWTTSLAQVYYEHFSSPWTMVAFAAASLGLALTAVQTWTAINPI